MALEHEDDEPADEAGHVRGGVGGEASGDKQQQQQQQQQHSGGLPPAGPDFGASREGSRRSAGAVAADRAQERRRKPIQSLPPPLEDDEATDQRAARAPRERRPAECGREEEVNGQALSQALARKTRYVLSGNSLAVFESCSLSPCTHARAHTHTHTHTGWRLVGIHEHHLPLQYHIHILCHVTPLPRSFILPRLTAPPSSPSLPPGPSFSEHRRRRETERDSDARWEGVSNRDTRLMLELQQLMHEYVEQVRTHMQPRPCAARRVCLG